MTPKIKAKNKKFLEEAEPLENKQPIVINKSINIDDSTDADESKSGLSENKSEGKFRKRFMNRLPKNSGKIEDAGEFQWIHRPTVEIDRSHSQQLFVQLQSWNNNLKDLITRLARTNPQEGMKGEIQYWNEMANLLDAADKEAKSSFVESALQILQEHHATEAKEFRNYIEQISAGMKEAKWNKKYMNSIDKPITIMLKGSWKEIAGIMPNLMDLFRGIYEKSNFYKEARIVSFLDHMYQFILNKMKKEFTIQKIMN